MPNAVGRGERISSDFIYGSKNAVGWSLNFIKPLYGHVQLPWALAAFFLRLYDFNHYYNKTCMLHKSKITPATSPVFCNCPA